MGTMFKSCILFAIFSSTLQYEVCQNETELNHFRSESQNIHRISKRALVFPKGSAFVVSLRLFIIYIIIYL